MKHPVTGWVLFSCMAVFAANSTVDPPTAAPMLAPCIPASSQVRVVLYPNSNALNAAYLTFNPGSPKIPTARVSAFTIARSVPSMGATWYDLHLVAPASRTDERAFYLWGHELAHVFCGKWHPEGEIL